jgi:hypothetical protein
LGKIGGAAFGQAFTAMFAHGLTAGATLSGRDVAILVGIQAGEGLFCARLDVGNDDRTTGFRPGHAALAARRTAMGAYRTGTAIGAGFARGRTGGVELSAADGTVVIAVQPVEAGVGAAGPVGLHRGAALIDRDRAVTIGVCDRQPLHALAHELGLAQPTVSVRIGAHATGRGLLGESGAGRDGECQGGQAAGQKGLFHLDDLHAEKWRCQSPVREV